MIHRTYGKTGTQVSSIGFGGMRFKDQSDIDGCAALVKAAYDRGITFFDTAPGYGRSEEIFGVALKEMAKTRAQKPFSISTKSSAPAPADIRRDFETSLKRMNLECVDFYHMWCVLHPASYARRKAGGAFKEFEKLKAEGLIRHLCVSTHMAGPEIREMVEDYPFEGMLVGYSPMNFAYREEGIEAAASKGMGVAIMNPLGGGLIPQHADRFTFVKTQPEESVVEGALRFLLNDARITLLLVGFSSIAEIDEAVRAVDGFKPIPGQEISRIRGNLKASFNELCTQCRYCDVCPEKIPVPKLMESWNHYGLSNKPIAIINRLRWHWGMQPEDACLRACVECGVCEAKCTQKLPIRERLKFIREEADRQVNAGKGT